MKQGVIMDIRGRKAVVLTPDGEFTTINLKRNHTLTIGSEIKLTPKPMNHKKGYFTPSMPTLAGMAALLLLVVLVTGVIPVTKNDAVAAYISFDINPSIEVGVNSDLEVVHFQAWNSDGEGLNLSKETKNMPLSEFGGLLVSRLDKDGYLSDGGKLLIVASDVERKERSEHIKDALEKAIRNIEQSEALKSQSIAITTVLNSDHSTRQEALEKGISPGKYVTYLSALDRGVSLTLSDVRDLSVKKIEALESQNMMAHESESTVPNKNSSELEDSVVQLNDKKATSKDETEANELILQEPAESMPEHNEKKDNSEETVPQKKVETPKSNKESIKTEDENQDDNSSNEVVNTEKKTENRVKKAEKQIGKSERKQNKADKKEHQKENKKDNNKNVKIDKQQEKKKKQQEKENQKKFKEEKKQMKDKEDEEDEEREKDDEEDEEEQDD